VLAACLIVVAGWGGRVAMGQLDVGNPPGSQFNTGAGACDLDFNNDGKVDAHDEMDFASVFSEGPCAGCPLGVGHDTIDFNADGSEFDPADLDAFRLAHAGGPCPNGWYAQPRLAAADGTPARWVYWSQERGNDAHPGTRELPVASQVRWYQILQEHHGRGVPVAGVLFRGETYREPIDGEYGAFKLQGTRERPVYIMADPQQDPTLPRPFLDVGLRVENPQDPANGGDGLVLYCGDVRVIGLHLRNSSAIPMRRGNGITIYGKGETIAGRVVIDDCLVERFGGNLKVQGDEQARENLRDIVINRSAFAGAWAGKVLEGQPGEVHYGGDAQGVFLSRVTRAVVRESVFFANGYNYLAPPAGGGGALPTLRNHNAYIVPNCRGVVFESVITGLASATNLQLRGGHLEGGNWARGVVSIDGPLGITGGHLEAPADLDWGGGVENCLVIGGGDVGPSNRRSLSIAVNRAGGEQGVVIRRNVIWRDPVETPALRNADGTPNGAAFWLQGPTPQRWTIADNLIYDPLLPAGGPTTAAPGPALRDDRASGATPPAGLVIAGNTFVRAPLPGWSDPPPSMTGYLGTQGVQVFDPSLANQTFVVLASQNRRGNWGQAWTAKALQAWWRERMGLEE
jgi:hypothetical protein